MRNVSATNRNPSQGKPSKRVWLSHSLKERGSLAHVTRFIFFFLWNTAFISTLLSGETGKEGKFPDTRVICFVHASRQLPNDEMSVSTRSEDLLKLETQCWKMFVGYRGWTGLSLMAWNPAVLIAIIWRLFSSSSCLFIGTQVLRDREVWLTWIQSWN